MIIEKINMHPAPAAADRMLFAINSLKFPAITGKMKEFKAHKQIKKKGTACFDRAFGNTGRDKNLMSSSIETIKRSLCEAGLRLMAEGLVARTWGNISIRIDERRMAVTPSGIMYEDILPEHIAVMDIITGRWESTVRPSGERKLHAAIYRKRPDVGAIVHTHQLNASVCAAARVDVEVNDRDAADILRANKIYCSGYGRPGTGKLTKETVSALKGGMCALMANHGAVCLGKDIDEAFTVSGILENVCRTFLAGKISAASPSPVMTAENICRNYLHIHEGGAKS